MSPQAISDDAMHRTMARTARTYRGLPVLSLDGEDTAKFAGSAASYLKDGFTIFSHGSPDGLSFRHRGQWIGPIDGANLAKFIRNTIPEALPRIQQGGLLVVACSTAALKAQFVEDVARDLNCVAHGCNVVTKVDGSISMDTWDDNPKAGWISSIKGAFRIKTPFPARRDRVSRESGEPVVRSPGPHELGSIRDLKVLLNAELSNTPGQTRQSRVRGVPPGSRLPSTAGPIGI